MVPLSARELQVLRLLADGRTVEQVAGTLYLSTHTVRTHARSAVRKLRARNRAHAVAIALRAGIIE